MRRVQLASRGQLITYIVHCTQLCRYEVYLIYLIFNTNCLADLIENCEKKCIILGDFNLPTLSLDSNFTPDAKCRRVHEAINNAFLQNCVDFPTHARGNKLDLALHNIPEAIVNVEDCGNLGNSDHSIIKLELNFKAHFTTTCEMIRDQLSTSLIQ